MRKFVKEMQAFNKPPFRDRDDEPDTRVTEYAWKEIETIGELLRPYNARQCKRIFDEAMKQRRQYWVEDRRRK